MSVRTVGVVLAGGASRRMGGSTKALMDLDGETLLSRAVRRLSEQVGSVIVNGPPELQSDIREGVPCVPDPFAEREGPLAGVLAALDWCRAQTPDADHVLTVAVDTPFFPHDLASRFLAEADGSKIAVARAGDRPQAVFALWPVDARTALRRFLEDQADRKIMIFAKRYGMRFVEFDDPTSFSNINTPDDLETARRKIDR